MAQSGYTPIQLYRTATGAAAPIAGNLADGELAINTNDGKLFYKDSGGSVQVMATKGTGAIGGSTTQVQYNNAGVLAGSANLIFNGTTLTAAGLAGPFNGTVGATTPNTGAFTTLTASGDVAVATNKFTVAAASGNTAVAGTLASGALTVAGTGSFTGHVTLSGSYASIIAGTAATGGAIGNSSGTAQILAYGPSNATYP